MMAWVAWGLIILAIGGLPAMFLLALPPWIGWCLAKGMTIRRRTTWRLELREDQLQVWVGSRARWRWPLKAVRRARDASNSGWTDSTFVEDALTLYDAEGHSLKVPASAEGFGELLTALRAMEVPISYVEVEPPVFFD
jgi:hypothetical protein